MTNGSTNLWLAYQLFKLLVVPLLVLAWVIYWGWYVARAPLPTFGGIIMSLSLPVMFWRNLTDDKERT
ncbi:TPA: hypothetical protein DCF80_03475 [Candidatus Saccharibacteria bacterium]|nr:hypothetical protein [Candidatus Saccharibacteria bacterium]HRK41286.1 hypothetical protein [Candidatus Saccharibacteria bacterium]